MPPIPTAFVIAMILSTRLHLRHSAFTSSRSRRRLSGINRRSVPCARGLMKRGKLRLMFVNRVVEHGLWPLVLQTSLALIAFGMGQRDEDRCHEADSRRNPMLSGVHRQCRWIAGAGHEIGDHRRGHRGVGVSEGSRSPRAVHAKSSSSIVIEKGCEGWLRTSNTARSCPPLSRCGTVITPI